MRRIGKFRKMHLRQGVDNYGPIYSHTLTPANTTLKHG